MKFPSIDLWHFFFLNQACFSVSHIFHWIIYVHIKYIKSKSNTQNCQVENNMKTIFEMEKFKSLVVILSKLHDHGKATSTSTDDDDDELFLCYGWPTKGV